MNGSDTISQLDLAVREGRKVKQSAVSNHPTGDKYFKKMFFLFIYIANSNPMLWTTRPKVCRYYYNFITDGQG